MAKVPPVVAEEDPSRKRKADEVAAPTNSAKKAKSDDVVTVSDDTTIAPSDPATEAALKTKEGASSPGVAEPASFGAGASWPERLRRVVPRHRAAYMGSPKRRSSSVAGTLQLFSHPWTRYSFMACLAQPSRYVQSPRIGPLNCSGQILLVFCFCFSRLVPECAITDFQRVGTKDF